MKEGWWISEFGLETKEEALIVTSHFSLLTYFNVTGEQLV